MGKTREFYGKGDPLMEAAFASCVQWAWSNPGMRREFERKSKMKMAPDNLSSMIDQATGYEEAFSSLSNGRVAATGRDWLIVRGSEPDRAYRRKKKEG